MDSPIKTPILDWKMCVDPVKGEGSDGEGEDKFAGWTDLELEADFSAMWGETLERLQLFDPYHTVMVKKAKTAPAATPAKHQHVPKPALPAKSPIRPKTPTADASAAAAGLAGRRESREWRPAPRLFLPLETGWVREVIYKQLGDDSYDMTKAPEIVYHAPQFPGTKPRTFKSSRSIGELNSYLAAKEPTLSYHNFSFHPKVMGAPKEQEKVRGERETVEIFPPKPAPPPPQPKKAIQTPATTLQKAKTPTATSSADSAPPSGGGLKVKLFSKMKEKNSQQQQPQEEQSDGEPPGRQQFNRKNCTIYSLTL